MRKEEQCDDDDDDMASADAWCVDVAGWVGWMGWDLSMPRCAQATSLLSPF